MLIGVINPEVGLFFLAFLPQCVHPERDRVWLRILILGALLAVVGFCSDVVPSLAGGLFVGLGVRLAMQSRA